MDSIRLSKSLGIFLFVFWRIKVRYHEDALREIRSSAYHPQFSGCFHEWHLATSSIPSCRFSQRACQPCPGCSKSRALADHTGFRCEATNSETMRLLNVCLPISERFNVCFLEENHAILKRIQQVGGRASKDSSVWICPWHFESRQRSSTNYKHRRLKWGAMLSREHRFLEMQGSYPSHPALS